MEPIEGSETSAFKPQTPGKYPKENILHKEHGESLKSRNNYIYKKLAIYSRNTNKKMFCFEPPGCPLVVASSLKKKLANFFGSYKL